MLNIDKHGRMTIEVHQGFEDVWRGETWYYAYVSKSTFWETRVSFVEDKFPNNPRKLPECLKGKDILGHFKTDLRGRISPNLFMKNLPGKVNYEEWGLFRDEAGEPSLVRQVTLDDVVKKLVAAGDISVTEFIEFVSKMTK